jgi:alanine racemase
VTSARNQNPLPDPTCPQPALRLAIDKDAVAANWLTLNAMSSPARAGAAVKADAYGIGAAKAVSALHGAGCRDFFVAHWSEAAEVAALAGPECVRVLHGLRNPQEATYAVATGVRPVINSAEQARIWRQAGGGVCDLMVDTGMNRLGVPMGSLGDPAIAALDIDTLHSHLVSADEDAPMNGVQLLRWQQSRAVVRHRRSALANSAGIALGRAYHGDLTRPGLALYGGVPRPELADDIRQVVRPQAAILQVRRVEPGETIGYNGTFRAPHTMRTGTIAMGYADGYLRVWSGHGGFTAKGHTLPVLGRVSMDMTVVDLSTAPEVGEGDWVEAEYSLPEASAESGLSQYELLTLLGSRFAR